VAARHRAFLNGLARKLSRRQFDPDDLVQDVLERAYRSWHRLPEGANVRAWLAQIMRNRFIDYLRRRRAEPQSEPADEDTLGGYEPPPSGMWAAVTSGQLRAKVAELPDEFRRVFELHAFEERSYHDIARELRIPMATVGTRLLRARQRLKQLLLSLVEEDR
jgi:RNA polymerase sigma-70 factor, ECF subfamily